MQSLIISGGHIEDAFVSAYIKKYPCDIMIAVDAGMSFFYRSHLMPDYIVGDFDSAAPEALRYFKESKKPIILQFQSEKDETDTELAIRTAIDKGCQSVHILGATGTRIDHVMGNIHLLGMAMEQGGECVIVDEHNRIRMIRDGLTIKKEEQYGTYVSLFPFTPQVKKLTLTGFKYPLYEYTLECYHSLGVSNEIIEEQAEISFQEGVLLVMESKD